MKPILQLRTSQHLTLTPQLQQSIKLLQLSTLDLEQEIERMLVENPMLERVTEGSEGSTTAPVGVQERLGERNTHDADAAHEQVSAPERASDEGREQQEAELGALTEWPTHGSTNRDEDEEVDPHGFQGSTVSLQTHLHEQISLSPLTDRDRALARFVIEALDDDGYLKQDLEELLSLLPPDLDFELDDLLIALRQVQSLDPPGVGARHPQECLALQLKAQPACRERDLALRIVNEHLSLLADRNFAKLKKELGCSDEMLRAAHGRICALNPHPGSTFSETENTNYIVPDVIVRKVRGRWQALLNPEAMPKLQVNALYAQVLQQNKGHGGTMGAQLQEARWLVKNIQQRFETILRVSQAIVAHQRQFFDYGEVAMRPLTLKEIADELELHESTISRVTTQKFMSTPRGVLELKYFFGSHVATDTGGEASSTAIRALIKQLVNEEDDKRPLSDAKIADLLSEQGIMVARRTVAKYRELMNIPPVSQRKAI